MIGTLKPNEIRYGNLIMVKNYPGPIEVHGIYRSEIEPDKMIVVHEQDEFYLEDCYPSPITEEFLLATGFEVLCRRTTNGYKNSVYTYHKNKFQMSVMFDDGILSVGMPTILPKHYVHELQNLFFEFFQKELTTNVPSNDQK